MNTKYDYDALEREYIKGTMGLRELARTHGIVNHSIITAQARKREWVRKRQEFQEGAANKAVVLMADDEGRRRAQEARVRDNAIEAIDEAITKMRADMKATKQVFIGGVQVEVPLVVIEPKDIALLIDRLNVLFGRPANITEERSLGINLSAVGNSPELLRGIVEATRGLDALGSGPTGSPIPRLGGAREN